MLYTYCSRHLTAADFMHTSTTVLNSQLYLSCYMAVSKLMHNIP